MKTQLRLTIGSIIIAEKLLNKPYPSFDYDDPEVQAVLEYAMYIRATNSQITLNEYKQSNFNVDVGSTFKYNLQFTSTKEQCCDDDEINNKKKPASFEFLGNTAYYFIVSGGLDPDYVFNKLELHEIDSITTAINNKVRNEMEGDRLWTFLSMLPHIGNDKIKSPSDIFTFEWEKEEIENEKEKIMAEGLEMLNRITNNETIN